jgi:hypothetical protein
VSLVDRAILRPPPVLVCPEIVMSIITSPRRPATRRYSLALLVAALLAAAGATAAPVGSTFTYQGELRASGVPAQGPHDFQVELYDADTGGSPITTVDIDDAIVTEGLFSLPLDFTSVPFEAGQRYWLALRVRDGAGTGGYVFLSPRQEITATPYALHALSVKPGSVGAEQIDTAAVQRRVAATCAVGSAIREIAADGTVTCETDDNAGGDISAVLAGTGIAGGGVSGTVTLSVDTQQIQRRVSAVCDVGSSIRAIAADGTVTCEADDAAPAGLVRDYQLVTATDTFFGGTSGTGVGEIEARCPIGKVAIAGGVDAGCSGAFITQSFPRNINPTSGWWGKVVKPSTYGCATNPATLTVYVICANVN